ncbi:MAG: hypothetical protein HZB67_01485 [Candidatus Aenigmarchaeota archaeon]|nr:hypothetical protein [Candidatus Aenigmarchaeota archaeon]
MHQLDTKNRSLFQPEQIQFKNYSADQISQILAARASVGLADGVASQALIKIIAGQSSDVRQALEILRQSVLKAEQEGSPRVEQRHIHMQTLVPELDERESLILQTVRNGSTEAGTIYDQCCTTQQMSYSTFYRTLQKLKAMQLLDIQQVGKQQGRTSTVTLRQ